MADTATLDRIIFSAFYQLQFGPAPGRSRSNNSTNLSTKIGYITPEEFELKQTKS